MQDLTAKHRPGALFPVLPDRALSKLEVDITPPETEALIRCLVEYPEGGPR